MRLNRYVLQVLAEYVLRNSGCQDDERNVLLLAGSAEQARSHEAIGLARIGRHGAAVARRYAAAMEQLKVDGRAEPRTRVRVEWVRDGHVVRFARVGRWCEVHQARSTRTGRWEAPRVSWSTPGSVSVADARRLAAEIGEAERVAAEMVARSRSTRDS